MSDDNIFAGMAALSICEALLLALRDRNILPESEIMGLMEDAAAAHENAVGGDVDRNTHMAVAAMIKHIIVNGNSARHT